MDTTAPHVRTLRHHSGLFIYVPKRVADDPLFPFAPGQDLATSFDGPTMHLCRVATP